MKIKRVIILVALLLGTATTNAADRILLKFEFVKDQKVIERGLSYVSRDPHTWSKGLQRSYLRLRCVSQISGEMKKLFATVNHFHGFRVTHQFVGNEVKLTVVRNIVKPRLSEIQALSPKECKELLPIVDTTKEVYFLPLKNGSDKSFAFGKEMVFRVKLETLGGNG